MSLRRGPIWWSWLFTGVALAAGLAGWRPGFTVAMVLTALQGVHFALRARSAVAFPVQVRVLYLGVLVVGGWPPLAFLRWVQFVGLVGLLAFDYCLAARILSLMPWNRRGPLTLARVRATFLSRPVSGSILQTLDRAPANGAGRD
jgi:hypothetical protein